MADPAGRGRPEQHGPEHHALRQRQHRGRGHDDAAPHRHEHAPGVVDVRQRPVGPVPLGPRDAAGLHAAGGPPDDARRRRTCRTRTWTAIDSPQTIAQSARNGVPISGRVPAPAEPRHHGQQRACSRPARSSSTSDGRRRRARCTRSSATARHGLHPVCNTSCDPADRPGAGLRALRLRADRRRDPAVVAGHERAGRRPSARTSPRQRRHAPHDPARPPRQRDALAKDGRVLVAFETPQDEVQAFDVPFGGPAGPPAQGQTPGGGTPGEGGRPLRQRDPRHRRREPHDRDGARRPDDRVRRQ